MSSVASYADHQEHSLYKKPSVHRNSSGELDVFEAANYFSSVWNISHDQHLSVSSHKPNKDNLAAKSCKEYEHDAWKPIGARMSLDVLGRTSKPSMQSGHKVHDGQVVKEKMIKNKIKQPNSPGGKLASFLNSLFNHSASKKKKNSKQDDLVRPRMRRSSISHVDSRSKYVPASTASATGFSTPPPVYKTFFDDTKSLQDHKRITPSLPKQIGIQSRAKSSIGLDHRPKISNQSLSAFDKIERNPVNGLGEKEKVWGDKKTEFEFKKVDNNNIVKHFEFKKHVKDDEEDGGDQSDTSSDLFELQNYDLGEFPSGLPVYETTNEDQIKNSAKRDSK